MGNIQTSAAIRSVLRSDAMRVLVAVAELGSVRAASEALSLSPSAVSKQLRKIEDQVGRVLFVRSRTGLEPTSDGEDLTKLARRFLALVDEVGERFDRDILAGRVRLGITDDVGLTRVPGVIRSLSTRYPSIEVALTVGHNSELLAAVKEQRLDIALVADGGDPIPTDALFLRSEPLIWIGGVRAGAGSEALPIAVSVEGCRWRARAVAALDAAGIGHRIACESPSTAGQIAAARAGLAVAPLPRSVVDEFAGGETPRDDLPALGEAKLAIVIGESRGQAISALREALATAYGRA